MPWKKGESGNPAGRRPGGGRTLISGVFLRAVARDFEEHGERVIAEVRERHPEKYLLIIAGLVPKQLEADVTHEYTNVESGLEALEATKIFLEGLRPNDTVSH